MMRRYGQSVFHNLDLMIMTTVMIAQTESFTNSLTAAMPQFNRQPAYGTEQSLFIPRVRRICQKRWEQGVQKLQRRFMTRIS